MIARTLRGIGALALAGLALAGWPAALMALADAVAVWLPDLSNPGTVLARPDSGGLFLVLVLALGWIAWVVWTIALVVEVSAQIRGVPTPHLGGLFPQTSATALVTTIAVAFTIAPSAPAVATGGDAARPAASSASHGASDRRPDVQHRARSAQGPSPSVDAEQGDYTVVRGDTLWDIADEKLDNPTRWPEIAENSERITQPDGRQLTDPDLILPGWTLRIPDSAAPATLDQADEPNLPAPTEADEPPTPESVAPPSTPMQPTPPQAGDKDDALSSSVPAHPDFGDCPRAVGIGRASSAGVPSAPQLPSTPLSGGVHPSATAPPAPLAGPEGHQDECRVAPAHGVLGLPPWITAPLIPTRPEAAPELVSAAEQQLAALRESHR